MKATVPLLNREHMQSLRICKEIRAADLQGIMDHLKEYYHWKKVMLLHGRGKRKGVHQRYLELFEEFLDR